MTDSSRTFIIDAAHPAAAEMLELRISRQGTLVLLHHNGGTKSFSVPQAEALKTALMAVLSGHFDLAITETELRLEAERAARSSPQPTTGVAGFVRPTLENL